MKCWVLSHFYIQWGQTGLGALQDNEMNVWNQGWGAVSDLSLILDLSQKFKHGLWRLKSKLKLSQKQHLTPVPLLDQRSVELKT